MPPIHRTLKNVVKNYSYAEVKVREATSNDPWGPTAGLMDEIAELTFDFASFTEIMVMIWKRINDHGKNWRHVYKALVLLEYLVRFGQEGVVTQCRENLVLIKTLRDFQHVEDGKDQGLSVREKAKQLVALLTDTEGFKRERARAQTRNGVDRFNAATAGSHVRTGSPERPSWEQPRTITPPRSTTMSSAAHSQPVRPAHSSDVPDGSRPTAANEEDLELQMALALSREQHEEEEKLRKGDEIKLQMAIEESRKLAEQEESTQARLRQYGAGLTPPASIYSPPSQQQVALSQLDDPWAAPTYSQPISALNDAWGGSNIASAALMKDPWDIGPSASSVGASSRLYPQSTTATAMPQGGGGGAWQSRGAGPNGTLLGDEGGRAEDEFSVLSSRYREPVDATKTKRIETWLDNSVATTANKGDNLWNDSDVGSDGSDDDKLSDMKKKKVTPEEFLGPHAKLVDFDDLVSKPTPASILNPFAITIGKSTPTSNPFAVKAQEEEKSKRVPLNMLQPTSQSSTFPSQPTIQPGPTIASGPTWPALAVVYTPQPIVQSSPGYNPFL